MTVASGTLVFGVLMASPASADDPDGIFLELSRDGVHYAAGEVRDIFGSTNGYVPGESRPGTIWVRNASNENAHFSVAVANTDRGGEPVLPAYLEFSAATATTSSSAITLPSPGHCTPVLDGWALAAGESIRLNLNLNLALDAPNDTRNQASSFDVVFLLQGINAGQLVSPCADESNEPGAAVSLGRAPVTSDTATNPPINRSNISPGLGIVDPSTLIMDYIATDASSVPLPPLDPNVSGPFNFRPQSNVVAINRTPWPLLTALSAGVYMVISFRRRRRNQ